MYSLLKLLLAVMLITVANQNLFAKVLTGDELRENVKKRLPSLNHTKLEALMERVGKKTPRDFYNCLCRTDGGGAAIGVHVSYHPEPLKPYNKKYSCNKEGPPCMAQGWGCWRFPLPSDPQIWASCIASSKYEDGSTIIDAIVGEIEVLHEELKPKVPKIGLKSLLKDLFEKSCLPVPKSIDNLNPHEMTSMWDILNKNHISSMTQTHALGKVYDNILNSKNICEAAIETKLSIEATTGKGVLGTAGSLVWIVKGKDEFDIFNAYTNYTSSKVKNSKYLSKIAEKGTSLISIFNYYKKYKDIATTYDEHIQTSQKNDDIKDALAVYKRSKSWDIKKVNSAINNFKNSQINIFNSIKRIEEKRDTQLKEIKNEEKKLVAIVQNEISKNPNAGYGYSNQFNELERKRSKIMKESNEKIRIWLLTSNSNLIKSRILEKYRKPLIEKSCNEYIDERLKNCPANAGRKEPLTHKDINKLWDKTKTNIRTWKAELKHINEIKDAELMDAPKRRIQK